jgi:hypothetical protein
VLPRGKKMANRSYLYSCDYVPEGIEQKKALTGIEVCSEL